MKIAIAGYGAEGEANYNYWSANSANEVTIVDESSTPTRPLPDGAKTILAPGAFNQLDDFDLVIRTAGLNPAKIKTNGKIWSATNEFFSKCSAPIIGVTGTKGKGTTASLIAAILSAANKKVWLVGNIGKVALPLLDDISPTDIVVFELSSFQLWDLEKSPHVAVITPVEPDHLNVHENMEDYVSAKVNISRHQTSDDICFYQPVSQFTKRIATANPNRPARRYGVADDGAVYVQDGFFKINNRTICSVDALRLIGEHNIENACAAISVATYLNIDNESIERGLRSFEGLPHRLEFVREYEGVAYYNDSFSSAPSASIAAIRAFSRPEIIILGGSDKGADFTLLTAALKEKQNIKQVIVVGEMRQKLAALLSEAGVSFIICDARTMPEIVDRARQSAVAGDVIILSPGCASLDMFRDFYDRGDQFKKYVASL